MLCSHADAIAFLEAAGVPASRREWGLGDTIVVPLGHPSTRDGITAYPAVAWLVPVESSWTIRQPVGQLERQLSFSTLQDACDAMLVIARAFAVLRDCQACHRSAQLDFGERGTSPQFWVALLCLHCGTRIESDDTGSLPDDLRALELARQGTWSVAVERPTEAAQWSSLRRELQLGLPELARLKASLPGNVFTGTFAEASRLCGALAGDHSGLAATLTPA
jgi:hypothetical protein